MKIEIDESRLSAGERRFLRDIMAKTKQAPEPELELDANGSTLWCPPSVRFTQPNWDAAGSMSSCCRPVAHNLAALKRSGQGLPRALARFLSSSLIV